MQATTPECIISIHSSERIKLLIEQFASLEKVVPKCGVLIKVNQPIFIGGTTLIMKNIKPEKYPEDPIKIHTALKIMCDAFGVDFSINVVFDGQYHRVNPVI